MEWEQLITIVAAVLGASGLTKGVEIYIRRRGSNNNQEQQNFQGQTSPDIVTGLYCRESRKEIMSRFDERDKALKVSIDRLADKVGEMGTQLAGMEAMAIKASNGSVSEHERRFHKRSRSSS